MLRKLALVLIVAGFVLPFLMTTQGMSAAFVAQSSGDRNAAAEAKTHAVSTSLTAIAVGFAVVGIGLTLFFVSRRRAR